MCSHSKRGGKHKLSTPGNTSLPASYPNSQPCLPDLPCKDINWFLSLKALKLDGKSYNPFDLYWETEGQAREFPLGVSSEVLRRELFYLIAWFSLRAICTSLCDVQEHMQYISIFLPPFYDWITTQSFFHGSLTAAVYCPLETGWQQPTAPPQQLAKVS